MKKQIGMERRTVLRGLATGIAGAVTAPAFSSVEAATGTEASTTAQAQAGSSILLNEPEMATLVSLSEVLVPGSVDAGAPALLDRVVAVDTPEVQRDFLASLRAFEGAARRKHASRWVELDPSTQKAMLREATGGSEPELHAHFIHLRDTVTRAYLATEAGMRRLGWTERNAWRELTPCQHPDGDHR